ncbi:MULTISPECIES: acyltransferase [unclassified Mucilaginibacter]|uniref:acyltransferase n=1 Tax=unclassified Mucilaginibacter TaxID=2617802 RepID=UPI002AC9BBFD|nr:MULTISPECIES: acyltransferase [unclassified Mucilaginibacter]MEB0261272.1 acyltransferase [Mucilaginibacter sp. 10I4]MEB0279096.1 acyltransferase [Mucilaginibacter sp. 10B2]MEB0299885.1 acyltransferase [Mucilaginibacter sp. 5C4]WPX22274.1 acyltransferase [Mucilaginibacter sp. 5C4]
MSLLTVVKSNPRLKSFVHWMIVQSRRSAPRLWVKWFVNPFIHTRGKRSIVSFYSRLDIFPFNHFKLGAYSVIEDFAVINNGVGDIIIGEHTGIGLSNILIGPVTLGNYVTLAQHIVLSGLNHGFEDVTVSTRLQKVVTKQITVCDDVWIGANSVITAGVTIGKHSVIGAGSVVTKDIPEYCVAVGNPAKVIKKYNFETATWDRV